MNLQERLVQCQEDIKKLKEQELKLQKQIKKETEIDESKTPVFSKTSGRLFIKMTPNVRTYLGEFINKAEDGEYWTFEPDGLFGYNNLGNKWKDVYNFYGQPAKSVFEDSFPTPKV